MAHENDLVAKAAIGWSLYIPGEVVDYPVRWEPRTASDHSPWVVVGTEFRFSNELVEATPPPDERNMVCRACFHPLSHSHCRWVHIDGLCEGCAVAELAADVENF